MLQEKVLVVATHTLFPRETDTGFISGNFDAYAQHIVNNSLFLERAHAEEDPTHKQIIPYLVFMHDDKVFMMQRRSTASEQRLKNKLTLGIGGHIRQEDFAAGPTIAEWAQREFQEEVAYDGNLSIKPLGIININTTPVDAVHAGFVYLLTGDSANIAVKSELKSGKLTSLAECRERYDEFERWSQLVIDHLTHVSKNR